MAEVVHQEHRSITRGQVKTFVVQKHPHYTPKYVKNLVRTLHMIWARTVDEEVLDRNHTSRPGKYLPEQSVAARVILDSVG